MLRTTIKIGSTALAAVLIAVPIASGKSQPRTPSIGQGYSLGVPMQHLSTRLSSRASGPFTTDTLGGNGGGIIAAPAESQTDGGLLSAAMKSHAAQVGEPRTPGYRFI